MLRIAIHHVICFCRSRFSAGMKRRRNLSSVSSRASEETDDSRCTRRRRTKTSRGDNETDLREAVRNLQKVAEQLVRRTEEHREKRGSKKRRRTPSPMSPRNRRRRRLDAPMASTGDGNWSRPSRLPKPTTGKGSMPVDAMCAAPTDHGRNMGQRKASTPSL